MYTFNDMRGDVGVVIKLCELQILQCAHLSVGACLLMALRLTVDILEA